MKGRSDTLNNDCYFVYLLVIWNFEIWPVIWPQMHLGRFCLSLLTGKDSCLTEMSLDRNAREYRALRESLISIMISYYWSNVDNGFQTNASSFLAAALNSSDLETKGATCLSRESYGEQKGEQMLAHCMIHLVSRPWQWKIVVVRRRRNTAIGNFCRCQNEIAPQ